MVVDNPLVPVVEHLRAGVYTCAAGGTILIYDILLTTKDEMRLIWPSRFSLVKCLYFMNRYLPVPCLILGMHHLANFRGPLSIDLVTLSQMIGQAISLITATWLLVLRVIALYGGNKWVAIGLYTVFFSTHLVTIVLSVIILANMWGDLAYIPFISICSGQGAPARILGVAYLSPVLCESVLVAMQLFHAWRHTQQLQTLLRPTTPLLRTLYADGFAYFVLVASLRLWSAFIFMAADISYWYTSTYLEFALISTSVSRLVLHLRGSAEVHRSRHLNLSTSMPLSHLSQSQNPIQSENTNTNRYVDHKPSRTNQNRQSRRSKPKRNAQTTSSFQNPSHTIYEYDYDYGYPSASETPQVHFSSSEHLRRPESGISSVYATHGYEDPRGSILVGPQSSNLRREHHRRHSDMHGAAEEGHRCDICCEDVGVVEAGRNDDHSYGGFFPSGRMHDDPSRTAEDIGDEGVEREVDGIEREVRDEEAAVMRRRDGGSPVRPPGIEEARALSPGIG